MTQAKASKAPASAPAPELPPEPSIAELLATQALVQQKLAGHRVAPLKELIVQVRQSDIAGIAAKMEAIVPGMPEDMLKVNLQQIAVVLRNLDAQLTSALAAAEAIISSTAASA
ncbi:MAG: hypothetical protein JWP92_3746 [Caulobacter sp.]|nr:hypothetical protein [Caulobacter sp.]